MFGLPDSTTLVMFGHLIQTPLVACLACRIQQPALRLSGHSLMFVFC
jgi:hypothetical protein